MYSAQCEVPMALLENWFYVCWSACNRWAQFFATCAANNFRSCPAAQLTCWLCCSLEKHARLSGGAWHLYILLQNNYAVLFSGTLEVLLTLSQSRRTPEMASRPPIVDPIPVVCGSNHGSINQSNYCVWWCIWRQSLYNGCQSNKGRLTRSSNPWQGL